MKYFIQKVENVLKRVYEFSGSLGECQDYWDDNNLTDDKYIFVNEDHLIADEFTELFDKMSKRKFEDGIYLTLELHPCIERLRETAEKCGYVYSIEYSDDFFVRKRSRKYDKTIVFHIEENIRDIPQKFETITLGSMLAKVSELANSDCEMMKDWWLDQRIRTINHLWND